MSMNCVAATPFGNKTCRQAYANACSPIRPCQLPPIPQMRWPAQRQLQRQSANELWSLPTMDALRARYAPVDRRKAARVARARARALLSPSPPSTMDANAPVRAEVLASASVELCAALLANLHRVVDSFRELDFNGDGRVERREFVRAARTMPALDRFRAVELAALFDSIDIDHNGSIEYAELHRLLREREDVSLAPELRTGACGAIELHAANAIELRGMRGADEVRQARAQLAAEQDAAATRLQAHIRRKMAQAAGRRRAAAKSWCSAGDDPDAADGGAAETSSPAAIAAVDEGADSDEPEGRILHQQRRALDGWQKRRAARIITKYVSRWVRAHAKARALQSAVRGSLVRKAQRREVVARSNAATGLQAAYRGHATRGQRAAQVQEERRRHTQAAMVLQARARGRHTRRETAAACFGIS